MSVTTSSLRLPASLWARAIEDYNASLKTKETRPDSFVYIVGTRSSGKSTLLNRFIYPSRIDLPKPSDGLEYTFVRRPNSYDHERKDLAHIWEIGGSPELGEKLATADNIFLTYRQVTTAVVLLVLDLSVPSSVLPALTTWLDRVKAKLSATYSLFDKKGLQIPQQLRARAKSKVFGNHEDKDLVEHTGIALLIVATKYDTFKDQGSEARRLMAQSLRAFAHAHGAHLLYTSSLNTAVDGPGAKESSLLLDTFSKVMNHLMFVGLEKKMSLKMTPQVDPVGPIIVPAGSDKFSSIGRPSGRGPPQTTADVQQLLEEWRQEFSRMWPAPATSIRPKFVVDPCYREEEVDLAKKRAEEQLQAYRKEQEAIKAAELAKKRAAAKALVQEGAKGGEKQKAPGKAPPGSSTGVKKS